MNDDAIQALHPTHPAVHRGRGLLARSSIRLVAIAFAVLSSAAFAAEPDAHQLFATGRAAFERQDYPAALEAFELAAKAGLAGPAVHFNIGVAAFRAGHDQRAEAAFREVARTPDMAALAYYNLGLVELRRRNSDSARSWFKRVEQATRDERLRGLAAAQLAGLSAPADRNWAGYAAFGAGYDDNVALVSDSEVIGISGVDDAFAEVQLAFSAPLGQPWRFDGGLVLIDYYELDRFDQLGVQAGARYRPSNRTWIDEVGLQLAYSMLDREAFENRSMLTLRKTHSLSTLWQVSSRYRFSYIDGMSDFAGVGGHRHDASARLARQANQWQLGFGYAFEISKHDDETLSARRHRVVVDAARDLDEWFVAVEASLQNSQYEQDTQGEENRILFSLSLSRPLRNGWRFVVRYDHADNDADNADFNYGRNMITTSIEAIM